LSNQTKWYAPRIMPDGELGKRDQSVDLKKEAEIETKNEEEGMAPLFLFLTSSLNVEMVYVILQGIS
jgi:hypothetical protein